MFEVKDLTIYANRGDVGAINVTAEHDGGAYTFHAGDVVRLKVFEKKACDDVVLRKDVTVMQDTEVVEIVLHGSDTTFGEVISKPVDYWYEIELNPDTMPQTILGYDEDGPKIFRLYPEGGEGA